MKAWRSKYGEHAPVEVEVEQFGYPHRDADGNQQYDNTHFRSKAEAWEQHLAEHDAGAELALSSLKEVERRLAEVKEHYIRASRLASEARRAKQEEDEEEQRRRRG